ncbi:MAG: SDR family NAD(P)-dependent oxidoreductase [Anaerolineae bacterium]|nr:SDR family NAD(P)-dependent oxidoreductase [Anaerolineae bacterium]
MEKDRELPANTPLSVHKRAVIVGASSGIGAALARRLIDEGYFVALLARRVNEMERLADEINSQAGEKKALVYQHDVNDHEAIPGLFQTILRELKGIDTLVYVSGAQYPTAFSEYNFDQDAETIEVNLLGAVAWLGRAASFFEHLGDGQIVAVSSVAGDRGRVGNPAYHASKAGLSTYLESLRNRLTRSGINVLTVKPGFVDTETLRRNAKSTFGVISPDKAAAGIWRAMRRRRQVVYLPGWWRWMMLVIRHIPSFIFRRLSF